MTERRIKRENLHWDRRCLGRRRAGHSFPLHKRTKKSLANPPHGVRTKGDVSLRVEPLDGSHQSQRPLLDKIEESYPAVLVTPGEHDDEPQVAPHHLIAIETKICKLFFYFFNPQFQGVQIRRTCLLLGATDVALDGMKTAQRLRLTQMLIRHERLRSVEQRGKSTALLA